MATLKPIIMKPDKRADGTWNVKIRITHNRAVRNIPTSMYVSKEDITSSFKIKNRAILDKCDDLMREYRRRLNAMNLELNDLPLSLIVEKLVEREERTGIDFIAFAEKWITDNREKKGIKNYVTALNAFKKFFGRDVVMCDEVTSKVMREFEQSLSGRAASLYTSSVLFMFREARKHYNDEDIDRIVIRNTVASYKPPRQNVAEKRALTEEVIRRMLALEYNGVARRDLALDVFKLSFFMMGTNAVDLYNATEYDGVYFIYNRTKTKGRRSDKAEMRIKVHESLLPLFEKYKDDERVFNFHRRYAKAVDFGRALNIGLKSIAAEVGVDNIQFYSIRHSFATIAVNDVRINQYIVNDMLCHVDANMRVTNLYIRKDYGPMNDANFQFIEYFLKK